MTGNSRRLDYKVKDLTEVFGIVKPRKDYDDVKANSLSGSFNAKRTSRLNKRKSVEELLHIV